ncbi:retrotransposon protein, putative, ty1-copia subclass [Tanacetum coccineum]
MTRKLFPHRTERATDLLGIMHTDVCGPLRHVSRQDRGGEYISQEFKDYLKACGIVQQLTPAYTPHHNSVSERRNRTLLDMVRSMMNLTTLSLSFWDYALETATHILNMVPTKKVDKTPYELWYGKVPNWSYLKDTQRKRLVTISTSHLKTKLLLQGMLNSWNKIFCLKKLVGGPKNLKKFKIKIHRLLKTVAKFLWRLKVLNRLKRKLFPFVGLQEEHSLGNINEPTNYKAAMLDTESDKWLDAMNAEMQSMKDNQVWLLVDLPPNCKTVGSKWLFKKKTDMYGIVHTYKARLVAKGYTQSYGVDYEEKFSHVADIRAIRILIAIAALYDYEIWQMDVKIAFLNGYLDEDIYIVQPEGEATFILGIKIYWDRSKRLIGLSHSAYIDKILKRYKMDNSKRGYIPIQERLDLNKIQGASTPKEVKRMQNVPYASAVAALLIANEHGVQRGARHYHRRYHYVRECIELGEINFLKVHTDENLSDPFTKALPKGKLTQHARSMGLRLASSFM